MIPKFWKSPDERDKIYGPERHKSLTKSNSNSVMQYEISLQSALSAVVDTDENKRTQKFCLSESVN